MNIPTNIRWMILFGVMILVPTGVLTVLAVRTLVDDEKSALADLQSRLPYVRQQVDQVIEDALHDRQSPAVMFHFELDRSQNVIKPRFQSINITDRRPEHVSRLASGHRAEYVDLGPTQAIAIYQSALLEAGSEVEKGELQNLLGRVYARSGQTDEMMLVHRDLIAQPDLFDPDGAHLASLSAIRVLDKADTKVAKASLEEWLGVFESDIAPLFPGTREYLRVGRRISLRRGFSDDFEIRIERLKQRARFLEETEKLHLAGSTDQGAFVCGTYDDGSTGLVHYPRMSGNTSREGVSIDVKAVANRVSGLIPDTYGLLLFDLESLPEIEKQTSQYVRTISSASEMVARLNVVLYIKDQSFLAGQFRQGRSFDLMGVFAMTLMIGVGVWLVYRGGTRELELARLRSDFVSNVSHELRTPLQAIRMYAETLSLGRYRDETQQQRYLDTITQESNRLSRMVNNVLDFSRLEGGRLTYRLVSMDLGSVVNQTLDELEPGLLESGFRVTRTVNADLHIVGDPDHVDGVVGNLIANAAKYSREMREIDVSVVQVGDQCCVEVSDRGVGVPEDDRVRVFERFQRASNVGDVTGAGLGLALVKDVMVAHSGSVDVETREGGGSVFKLSFPKERT
jgi:signal transduction histidine kinase